MIARVTPELEHPLGHDGLLVLRLTDGDARLSGVDGDLVTVRSTDGEPLDGFAIEAGERSIEIRAHANRSADLDVRVPRGATVILEARSADVTVSDLTGDVRLTTASGDLTARGVSGTLSAEAVSGDVEITATGTLSVVARTVSGDLELRAAQLDSLTATTTSGDLEIAADFVGDGPFVIETVSGDTSLAPRGDIRIEPTTLTGDVSGRGIGRRSSSDRGPIVVGSGDGPTIAWRSTSGDLTIDHRPSRAEPPAPPAIRPSDEDATQPDDPTMAILHALERGEIDLDEASDRLAALDAGRPEERR